MKSDFINCKNCTDDCHCKGKDITPICISFKPAKTTNGDKIRAMIDEELAEWVWGAESAGRAYGPRGEKAWLDWLRQEAIDA